MRWALVVVLLAGGVARAEPSEPSPRSTDELDGMNVLARHHLHDLDDERWNLYGQLTWIESFKLPFHAAYTDVGGSTNSLRPGYENSFTGSFTIYAGARLWHGAELYLAPETVSEVPLSDLHGLGGAIQNFELQKGGNPVPIGYLSRAYLQQTIGLGGEREHVESEPLALGHEQDHDRIVITAGRLSVVDIFDRNSYAADLRRQMFDMAFMTYAAFDFPADLQGYTIGAFGELYLGDWAVRIARELEPKGPNQGDLEYEFWKSYGDQVEVEHDHELAGHPGAVRVLGFHDHATMGRFQDAIVAFGADPGDNAAGCEAAGLFHYDSTNPTAPDLCWVRRPNDKWGIGINIEQEIAKGIGVFLRAMYADGQSEVYAFTSADRSLALGVLARGGLWHRRDDYAGAGFGASGISKSHADYLKLGGIDAFVGDGRLAPGTEMVGEAFYGFNVASSIWISGDYELIVHPGFNVDRGPVSILGARLHAEF